MIVGGIPMLLGGNTSVSITLTGHAWSASDLTTYTFAGLSLGDPASSRLIVIGVGAGASGAGITRSISALTVAGVAAAKVVEITVGTVPLELSAVWIVSLPTGTVGDVVVTFSGGMLNGAVTVHRLVNAKAAAFHTATDTSLTTDALSAPINLTAGGAAIGSSFSWGGTAPRAVAWTNLAERTDQATETNYVMSSATTGAPTATETVTVTAQMDGATSNASLVLASFSPL